MTARWGGARWGGAKWAGARWGGVKTFSKKYDYLIKNGLLASAVDFTRTGSAIYDGVVFTQDMPVRSSDGAYVTCGARTNLLQQSKSLAQSPWVSTVNAVTQVGDYSRIAITVGVVSQEILVTPGDTITFGYLVKNNGGTNARLALYDVTNAAHLLYGDNYFDEIDNSNFKWVYRTYLIPDGCLTLRIYPARDPGGPMDVLVADTYAVVGKYPIHPFSIPTTSGPVTMATAGASDIPGNLNGATVDLYDLKNLKWLEIFDGKADGVELAKFPAFLSGVIIDTGGSFVDSGDSTYRITSDGTAFVSSTLQGVLTPGLRYQTTLRVHRITTTSGVKINAGSDSTFGYLNTVGSLTTRETAINGALSAGRQTSGVNTDVDFDVSTRLISPATGALLIEDLEIIPTLSQWETTGPLKILMGDAGNAMFQVNNADGKFELTDGTNTIAYDVPYVAGTKYTIILAWSEAGMYLIVNGVQSPTVPFVGTFNLGRYLKFNGHEDIVRYVHIRTHKIAA